MKRVWAMLLCLSLALSGMALAAAGGLAAFVPREEYTPGQFADVDEDSWYGANDQGVIQYVCELGIMQGMGDGTFAPESGILCGEAVKMAAVVHSIYNGGDGRFTQGDPWYQVYVDYAVAEGLILQDSFDDYEREITREELAWLYYSALPGEELPAINPVSGVTDLGLGQSSRRAEILALYRAGVLTGDAEDRAFRPKDAITRAEAAAILTRLVNVEKRQRFEILPPSGDVACHDPYFTLYDSTGAPLISLGYQSQESLTAYLGTVRGLTDRSLDFQNGIDLVMATGTGLSSFQYLQAREEPLGAYVYMIVAERTDWRLHNGVRCGMSESQMIALCGESNLTSVEPEAWSGLDAVYAYQPPDSTGLSPLCQITLSIQDGQISSISLGCSIY